MNLCAEEECDCDEEEDEFKRKPLVHMRQKYPVKITKYCSECRRTMTFIRLGRLYQCSNSECKKVLHAEDERD